MFNYQTGLDEEQNMSLPPGLDMASLASMKLPSPPPTAPPAPVAPDEAPMPSGPSAGQLIARAFAGLGDAVTGAYGNHQTNFGAQADNAIDQEQKRGLLNKQYADKKKEKETALALQKSENDPNSEKSRSVQAFMQRVMPNKDFTGMPYSKIKEFMPNIVKLQESENTANSNKEKNANEKSYHDQMVGLKKTEVTNLKDYHDKDLANKGGKAPEEIQKSLNEMATKTVNTVGIKNSLTSSLELLRDPQVPEDLKVKAGQLMLKTLNSQEGKDAVNEEEAKRMGSFLELKLANYKEPGSFVGRDLDKFIDQVGNQIDTMGNTIARNQDIMDGLKAGHKISEINPSSHYKGYTSRSKEDGMIGSAYAKDAPTSTTVRRQTADGRVGIFDGKTKQFIKYEE